MVIRVSRAKRKLSLREVGGQKARPATLQGGKGKTGRAAPQAVSGGDKRGSVHRSRPDVGLGENTKRDMKDLSL